MYATSGVSPLRFGAGHIRIKPEFSSEEDRAMKMLSAELKVRLTEINPSEGEERLEKLSQWGTRVMATLVNLNNRLKNEGPVQAFLRHIEEWFADHLGLSMTDHSLSPEETRFLDLIPKLGGQAEKAEAQAALKTLFNLYDQEHLEGEGKASV